MPINNIMNNFKLERRRRVEEEVHSSVVAIKMNIIFWLRLHEDSYIFYSHDQFQIEVNEAS